MMEQQEIVSSHGHEAFWTARKNLLLVETDIREAESAPQPVEVQDEEIDQRLATIWSDLLGVERITPNADFFELGGDSLVAIRMIERVKEIFNVEQTLASLFAASTFQQVSDSIRMARERLVSVQ